MLEEQIQKEYVQAMKDKDSLKSSTLSFLRAAVKSIKIDQRLEGLVPDAEVIAVIKKQVKQRQDSIQQFNAGGRPELALKEEQELAILKTYLPKEMSEESLNAIIVACIKESQSTSVKDMGKVMKLVMDKVSGQADNRVVSDLVKKNLSQI